MESGNTNVTFQSHRVRKGDLNLFIALIAAVPGIVSFQSHRVRKGDFNSSKPAFSVVLFLFQSHRVRKGDFNAITAVAFTSQIPVSISSSEKRGV